MSATFKGKTQLDTSGMRRGLAQMRRDIRKFSKEVNRMSGKVGAPVKPRYQLIRVHYRPNLESLKSAFKAGKKMADTFRQSVAAPFRELASNMERTIKRASLAALAISGLGVRNVFQYEAIQEQFTVLMKDSAAAKKRVQELADLAKQSPFSLTQYVQAAKTLYAVGNEALGTNEMIQKVGDSAAAMGVDMWQASIWVARLYNSLKSGSGVGTTADDMMRAGMLTAENYAKMVTGSRRGMPFEDLWALAMKDLSRFEGGMDRMSKTGTGSFMKLRDNIHMASIDMFGGMADSLKDVLYTMNEKMASMFKAGTFKEWGAKIGDATRDVINYIGRVIETWKRLSDSSKATFKKVALYGGTLFMGLRTGLIQPLTQLIFGLGTFSISTGALVGKSVIALSGLILTAAKPVLGLFSLFAKGIAKGTGLLLGIPHGIAIVIKGIKTLQSSIVSGYNTFIALLPKFKGKLLGTLAFTGKALAALGVALAGYKFGNFISSLFSEDELAAKRDALKKYLRDIEKEIENHRVYGIGSDERYERNINRKKEIEIQFQFLDGKSEPFFEKFKKAVSDNFSLKGFMQPLIDGMDMAENAAVKAFSGSVAFAKESTSNLWKGLSKGAKATAVMIQNFVASTFKNLTAEGMGKKFKETLDKMLSGAFGTLPEDFQNALKEIKRIWEETKGFQIMKAPKLKSIRKQLQTEEALNDVRKIYAYTLRGIYAGGRGFRFANNRNGGFAKFKTFADRRNVRRLDSQLVGRPSLPDRSRFARRSDVKPVLMPVKQRTAPRIDLSPLVPPYMRKFAPFVVPQIFRKAHDPASIIAGAMTPKTGPKQEPKAPKEVTDGFAATNNFLREIRDKVRTLDGTAVYA